MLAAQYDSRFPASELSVIANKMEQLSKSSCNEDIKCYFLAILSLAKSGSEFPVDLDEVWPLVYARKDNAVRELTANFLQGIDYQVLRENAEQKRGGSNKQNYSLSIPCLEYFIARKVRSVFEIYRTVFHKVAEACRVPQTFAEALQLAANQARQIEKQNSQLREQQQILIAQGNQIAEMQPKAKYTDEVLQSTSGMTFTEVAKELGYRSAKAFLDKLVSARVLYRQSGRYLPMAKYSDKGYFSTRTHRFYHSDGRPDCSVMTVVTQKGRAFLNLHFNNN